MSGPNIPPEYPQGYPPASLRRGRGRLWLRVLLLVMVLGVIAVVVHSMWRGVEGDALLQFTVRPPLVMGTQTSMVVTAWDDSSGRMSRAAYRAEQALRDVEADMSTYISGSGISRFNASEVGQDIMLTRRTIDVLELSRTMSAQTDGAFDVTCRAILQTWKHARDQKRLPTDDELAAARQRTGWDKIELTLDGARKTAPSDGVDLGGIAKGYAIDRAIEALQASGMAGGLVDVGGDIRCFGMRKGGKPWGIVVQNPFNPTDRSEDGICRIELTQGAVCTSGNYFRYFEIDGKRFSHIVDPRTAKPVESAPSVTVVAPTAAVADAWATALSVLGEEGLSLIEGQPGIEAMLVIGTARQHRVAMTSGFRALMDGPMRLDFSAATAPATNPATAPATRTDR